MKKLISVVLAFAMCLSLFAGVGLIASADDAIDRYINVTGGTIVFENDAEHPWAYDSISIGKYGASSGNAGVDSSSSTVSTTLTFAEGEGICFTWKVSGQQKWDYLAFSIDGEEIARISGSFGPETRTFAVPAGEHTLAWTYVKDEAYGVYDDKGYLDEVHVVSVSPDANNLDSLLDSDGIGLSFENDAVEPWTNNGSGAAVSGNAGKSASESAITLRKALTAGETLRFNWGVSSEKDHDFLVFEVNGEEYASISGEVDSATSAYYTAQEDGEYVFRWVYRKDTLNSFGADCGYLSHVTVSEYVALTGVIIVKNTTIATGKSLKLAVAARPNNATNKAVSWESDNEGVAVVSEDGTVTGISAGTANITVTTEEGGFTSVCALTVTPFAGDTEIYVNTSSGNDRNKGDTASAALRTLGAAYQLIYKKVLSGGSAKLYISGRAEASEELRIFNKEINIVALSEGSAITRASGYTGVLIRIAGGGILRLGDTSSSGASLLVGNSSAAAPAVLVDGGTCYLDKASISGNSSTVSGAGVYVKKGAFVMSDGSVASNVTSRYGGGIYAEEGEVTLLGGSVSGNRAGIYGGGAYIASGVDYEIGEGIVAGNTAVNAFPEICYGEPPAAPEIVGVEDGAEYSLDDYPEGVSAVWSGDSATATLNGEPYEEGSKITEPGDYVLTVTDGFSVVTVSFRVWQPSHETFWVDAFLSDNAAGETGWVGFDNNGYAEPKRYFVPEKPVAAAVYLAGTVYGYSEDGYFFTVDMDEELPEGALRYSNMVWSAEPVIADYYVLDMTYSYWGRDMVVLVADDANARYVAVVNKDGTVGQLIPIFDAENTEVSPLLMTIACNADGLYYAISGGDNAALWMLTGADENGAYVTKLFDIGGEAYYLQSMAFDLSNNTLYWAQCGMDRSSIYRVDIEDEFLGYCGSPLGSDAELTALLFFFDIDVNEEYESEDGRFTYSYLPEGGIEITGYNFKNENDEPLFEKYDEDTYLVEVPEQIYGVEVLSIGKYAFRDRSVGEDPENYMQIGKVILPRTLETVGYGAFRGCASLKEVEFGGQEHEIGDYAFYQCSSLTDAYLPWPLETIGYGAFSECASLRRVTISGPTENFGDYIFYNAPEDLEIWGVWPSATYDYAVANNITFRDLDPYEEPAVYGVEDGEVIVLTEHPDGCAINWDSTIVVSATLDGEPYEEWTPITAPGEHFFFFSDGRTDVEISFTIKEEYDTPVVSGVENGGVYNEGVTLTWDVGEATLNGEEIGSGAFVSEPGDYTLRVVNGDKETVVAFTIEQSAPPVKRGDMDGDGEITVADALRALRIAAKLAEETPEAVAVGDVDNDGEITVADALKILRVAAKLADQTSLQ